MAHRSQCSSAGDNPLDPNYLPPHYREEYRLAIDSLVEEDLEGYYHFLQRADVVDFLCSQEIAFIQNAVQVPREGNYGDQQRCLPVSGGDSSSDTYWPVHSDLDAPDLDLGWPQLNRFVGPTEVTTLVNPAEPDMPSIKEQARRMIKSSQQVVAIVMDMFTDVDIFAEILHAAMRNVAVYILLDELNAHHFVNMLSNCRVNLDCIKSLRVRTVSGISYQCRSGKVLKGQMMSRFLLTDSRAVLSGNYSFMWSFEKLHRCFAHLFLGQLVSNFDEEFRILYAQSQPMTMDNLPAPKESFVPLPERQYLTDRSVRESRKYTTVDHPGPDEKSRHNFDERGDKDWKNMPHNRHEDMYMNPSQQFRMGQPYDQSSSRMPSNLMEGHNYKRHSYAEGKQTYQPMQQPGMPHVEGQGGRMDAVYSAYDKFKNHAYPQVDQHPEPGLPHEMEQPESYDLVLDYLSSTSNVEMDKLSDNFNPAAELSTGSSRPKRLSLGKPQDYEPSPSHPNQPEQGSNVDRKDPTVRKGLRNWRINSYLSTCDNAGEEDMPLPTHQASDPFDETPNPSYNTVSGPDLFTAKLPNTLEFKVPAAHRPYPSFRRSNLSEDYLTLPAQAKLTPSTSESSLTEADKTDEMEQQEPKEESFRRKYNPAVQRSSRLRSSLIFSSQLDQPGSQDIGTATGKQDEDTDKAEGSESKLPFALQVLGHRKTFVKEPFEWSRLAKSATVDSSLTDASKSDDVGDKEGKENPSGTKPLKYNHKNTDLVTESRPMDALMRPSSSHCELSKIDQPRQLSDSLMGIPFVDMSDADHRLMFFKQLAAKRKAEKVSESAKANTDKVVLKTQMDPKTTSVKVEQPTQKKTQSDPVVKAGCEKEQINASTDSEKLELKKSQTQDPSLSDKSESSLKKSSIRDPSCVEQPASKSASIPNSSESSVAHNPVGVDSSLSPSVPLVSSSSEQIQSDVEPSKHITIYPTRPIIVREPFKWNRNVRSAIFDTTIKKRGTVDKTENSSRVEHPEGSDGKAPSQAADVKQAITKCVLRPSSSHCELSKIDQLVQPQSLPGESTVDMTVADNRLMFFKELAAKRKAEKAEGTKDLAAVSLTTHPNSKINMLHNEKQNAEGTGHSKEGETKLHKTALEKYFTKDIAQLTPTVSRAVDDDNVTVPMAGREREQSSVTTDSEKMELKKIKRQTSSSTPDQSPSTIPSQPLEVPPTTTPTETSTAAISRTSQNTTIDPTPSLSQPLSTMAPSSTLESNSTYNKSIDTREPAESPSPPSLDSSTTSSETPEEDATKSSPAEKVLSSDVETMKPESTSFPTEIPGTLSEDAESDAPFEACERDSKPTSIQTPSETLSEEPCAPSSEDELPPTESNSVALESSSRTAALPSKEDVEDITNASLSISLPQPCSADQTESSESSICNVEKEPVDSPKSNAADAPSEETQIEETVLPSSTLAPDSDGSVPPVPTLSEESPIPLVLETLSDNQTKPTLEVILTQTPDQTKLTRADETTIELKPIASESCPSEPIVAIEKSTVGDPCEVEKESTTTEEPIPVSPLSKQPKAPKSRYHSSTANVISSSNLRDDTKLLLGQISANSQNRSEPTKEQPVTDDDKESEADKKAKGQKDGGSKYKVRGSTKTAEEREVLLQKIQSMRKERKVYSRFETPQ